MSIKSARERILFFALGVVMTLVIQAGAVVAVALLSDIAFLPVAVSDTLTTKEQLPQGSLPAQAQAAEPSGLKADLQYIEEEVEDMLNLKEPEPLPPIQSYGGIR